MWISTFSCGIHLKIHEFCREKMSQCCGNNNNIDNGLKENRNHMAFVTRCEKYKSFLFWAFYLKYFSKTTRGDGVTAPAVARPPLPPPPCRGAAGGSSGGPAAPRATPATGAQAPAAPAAAGHRGRPAPRWGRGRVGPGTPTPPPKGSCDLAGQRAQACRGNLPGGAGGGGQSRGTGKHCRCQ